MSAKVDFTVFTKPWRMPLPELATFVNDLGFDGVELPVRPGYQVEPENVAKGLPEAARILGDKGVKIGTVAGPTDEPTIAACAEAGVPIIRICLSVDMDIGYMATEAKLQKEYEALVPLLDRYGVAIGIQNHCGIDIGTAMGVRHLIERFDPKHFCCVLDQAHCGLVGEPPELAIDIAWSHLRVMNLKSAYWLRSNGPEAEVAEWDPYWTSGRHGMAYWPRVAAELNKRGFAGDVCLTSEYSDQSAVDRLIAEDIAFAKSLFEQD